MDHVEARLKMAELACSMVEARLRALPEKYKTNSDMVSSYHLFYEAIFKDFIKTAPSKDAANKSSPPGVKA
ncbi:hypothetical protein [Serratia liquefaciens]|uniref:hypothetical protein n=1 Tax=Serratia liquefaciens TaxID=614 RepID=UPI0021C5AFA2|nr:hypothetical protein [Serratia liquefaciens]